MEKTYAVPWLSTIIQKKINDSTVPTFVSY